MIDLLSRCTGCAPDTGREVQPRRQGRHLKRLLIRQPNARLALAANVRFPPNARLVKVSQVLPSDRAPTAPDASPETGFVA